MKTNLLLISFLLLGCTDHIRLQHMEIEEHTGLLNKYVWTGIKGADGRIMAGTEKLTICPGYAGVIGDVMRNAAIVGSAALIGAGIGGSGDSNSTTNVNRLNGGNSSAVSGATANANAGAAAISGASIRTSPTMQTRPHHYRELKPHEHVRYGVD